MIYAAVRTVPLGAVTTYGEVAKALGMPRGARMVGWALRALQDGNSTPWQRVVGSKGRISIINPKVPRSIQAEILSSEGHTVVERHGELWLENPAWHTFPSIDSEA